MNLKFKTYKIACVLGISLIFSLSASGSFSEKLEEGRKALEDSLRNGNQPLGLGEDKSPTGQRVSTRIEAERPQSYVGTTLSGRFAEYMIFNESTIFKQIEILYEGFAEKSQLDEATKSLNNILNPATYNDSPAQTDLMDFYFSAQMISEDVDPRRTVTEASYAVDERNLEVAGANIRELYAVPYDPTALNVFWEAQKRTLPTSDAELVLRAVEMYLPAYELLLGEVKQYLTPNRRSAMQSSWEGFRNKLMGIEQISSRFNNHETVNGYFPIFFAESPIVRFGPSKEVMDQLPVSQLETIILIGDFFVEYPIFFLHGNSYTRENSIDALYGIVDYARASLEQTIDLESGESAAETRNGNDERKSETDSSKSLDAKGLDL